MNRAIEPVGEARTDYHAVVAVAEKLGVNDQVTDGFTDERTRSRARTSA